jgi:hypothetical protein
VSAGHLIQRVKVQIIKQPKFVVIGEPCAALGRSNGNKEPLKKNGNKEFFRLDFFSIMDDSEIRF